MQKEAVTFCAADFLEVALSGSAKSQITDYTAGATEGRVSRADAGSPAPHLDRFVIIFRPQPVARLSTIG